MSYDGPPTGEYIGVVTFSYVNCSGVTVNSSVGDGTFGSPTFRDVCAQEDSIVITGGDTGCGGSGSPCASWFPSFDDCCAPPPTPTLYEASISLNSHPTDACGFITSPGVYVSNIGGFSGNEVVSTSSVIYTDSGGTNTFPADGDYYKINIAGSPIFTNSIVDFFGNVVGPISLC